MATERQSPDGLLVQTNLSGSLSDIQDDPNSPDGNWLILVDAGTDTVTRVSFPTPTGNPTEGADLQQFQIWVRRGSAGIPKTPTVRIELYENGGSLATILADTVVTNDSGVLLSGTWNANLLSNADGSLVECYIYGTASVAGGNKSTIEVGAVEWNVDYTVGGLFYKSIAGVFTATGSITKKPLITLLGSFGLIGAVSSVLKFLKSLAGVFGLTGLLVKLPKVSLSGVFGFTGTVSRFIKKKLSGTITFLGNIIRTIKIKLGN